MFYMNAQLLFARTWTTRLCKKPKILRQLTKTCKSMASGVMYPYSGNTNSNNSNIGGTFRHDMTRWTPGYPRKTTPLRPTASVSGGVQVGGTSKSFSSNSILPSKISPGAVSSGKQSRTSSSVTSSKIFNHSSTAVEKWRNTTGSTVKSIVGGTASKSITWRSGSPQLRLQGSLNSVATRRDRLPSPLPNRRRSNSVTASYVPSTSTQGSARERSNSVTASYVPSTSTQGSARERSNSVSFSLSSERKSPPPAYQFPAMCTQHTTQLSKLKDSTQKSAAPKETRTTTVSPTCSISPSRTAIPQSPSRERRKMVREEERKRKEEEEQKDKADKEERRRKEMEEEQRRKEERRKIEKKEKERASRTVSVARPVTPSHTSKPPSPLPNPRLIRSFSTSSLSPGMSDGGWSSDASSQGSMGLSPPTWKDSSSTVKDCMIWTQGYIGCVTTARTTPVSPVLYPGSGGVRPVGQITLSSGERPLSPSFAASTATRVSEQSTQQRSVYFSTFAGTYTHSSSPSHSSPFHSSPSSSVLGSKGGVVGLWNLGNTCFMNCMLQCLGHTPEMTELFLERRRIGGLTGKYIDLMHQMWSPQTINVLYPRGLKDCISKIHPEFYGSNQHDAQELLRFLLAGLQNEWLVDDGKNKRIPQKMDIDTLGKLSVKEEGKIMWEQSLYLEDTPLARVFMGQLLSSLYCTSCGHTSRTFDPIWDLALPFPDYTTSKSVVDLLDCFKVFTREEVLDGADRAVCSGCKKLQCCHKTLTIHHPPPILVIHLKRFYGLRFRRKLSAKVRIPLYLDIARFLTREMDNELKGLTHYELYAIANHMGSESWGHYTATYKHHTTHKWYNVSDDKVYPSSPYSHEGIINSESAYVLFYRRVKDPHI